MNKAKFFYFIFFAAAAAMAPFLTLYYQSLGLTGTQIGLLAGTLPLVSMISGSLWSAVADASGRHRAVLLLAIGGAWLAVVGLIRADGLATLLPAVLLQVAFAAPIAPLIDSSVVALLGERQAEYGRVRLWGSVGWGVSALFLGPLLERAGLVYAFYVYLVLQAVVFALSFGMPLGAGRRQAPFRAGLRELLGNGRFLTLLLTAIVYGMSLSMILSYLFLHMRDMGAGESLMGLSLTVATITEVPFLFLSGRLLRRFGPSRLIAAALGLMALRAFGYAWMPAPWWVLVFHLLNGPTYALFLAAGVAEAARVAPAGLGATAQGAFSSAMMGLGMALGNLLGGIFYDQIGAPAMFRAVGWLLLTMLVAFVVLRRWTQVSPVVAVGEG